MQELSTGVYSLLKSTRRQHMSVRSLLDKVETSDEHLEANLCTMLQSVCGTKQYWFLRQSELRCMIQGGFHFFSLSAVLNTNPQILQTSS